MKKHLNIIVSGKVQGVWFRSCTQKAANQFNVYGFVKNLKNGTVYIEAESFEKNLAEFIEWCRTGPEKALVENIISEEGEIKNFTNFIIKRF